MQQGLQHGSACIGVTGEFPGAEDTHGAGLREGLGREELSWQWEPNRRGRNGLPSPSSPSSPSPSSPPNPMFPLLFLIPYTPSSSLLSGVIALSEIHFPRDPPSLAEGLSCVPWWVCWSWLEPSVSSPGQPLVLFHRLPPQLPAP